MQMQSAVSPWEGGSFPNSRATREKLSVRSARSAVVLISSHFSRGFPGGSDGKASVCDAGHLGSIPGSGRAPGEGNGTPLQYSCLENPVDGGAW